MWIFVISICYSFFEGQVVGYFDDKKERYMKIYTLMIACAGIASFGSVLAQEDYGLAAMQEFCCRHRLDRQTAAVVLKPLRTKAAAPVMVSRTGYGKPYPLITSSNPSVQPFVGITYRTPAD